MRILGIDPGLSGAFVLLEDGTPIEWGLMPTMAEGKNNRVNASALASLLRNANIELPEMYRLGYHNNNCIGCVKGGMGYWNKIKVDFPEHFDRMAKLERFKGQTVFKDRYLDELKPTDGHYPSEQNIECSIFCQMAEEEYK